MSARSLEKRIAAAFATDTTAADLAALLDETEAGIVAADQAADDERDRALDVLASPDANKARAAMEEAAFVRDRLRKILPRLQQRHQELAAKEFAVRWHMDCDAVEAKRDALVAEFRELYQPIEAKLPELLARMTANDEEIFHLAVTAPMSEPRRLARAELVARGLDAFSIYEKSIAETLHLPAFEPGQPAAWPPPKPSFAAAYATSMAVDQGDPRRYSGDWWQVLEEDDARRAQNEARWAEQEEVRQEESKRSYEASLQR
jgi:hypothetical protein